MSLPNGNDDEDGDMGPVAPRLDHAAMEARAMQEIARLPRQDAIRQRDVAGREMETLAAIASGSRNMSRRDIAAYIHRLVAKGDITSQEMQELLQTLPHSKPRIRVWARETFACVMWRSIQAHVVYPAGLFPGPTTQQLNEGEDASE